MKFKFLVDGIWRVDELQPIANDEYGVNNFIVVEQPVVIPETLFVDDGLPVMDIDGFDDRNLHADGVSNNKPSLFSFVVRGLMTLLFFFLFLLGFDIG